MTTPTVPTKPQAGPAQSVVVVTDTKVQCGPAIPVYGYPGIPPDGRSIEGAVATRVKVITDSDLIINGGTFWLEGLPMAIPVSSQVSNFPASSDGGVAIPVYLVGGSL